ncbi:hypothetical protein HW452_01345 [Halomonas aquamarina]|uniref:Uncharacterized protein n=1 Tax=Vreelandella aquamarina TaxID=77097 RepID=A0ACC5VPL0_9GAMM|nr:hypothetical protein [Halomonas aquamarina]MBZ5486170.1 hypothetical protein [Halomonas aquamarina]
MDKQVTASSKRPRLLSLCMVATAASVLMLAGCGDNNDDDMPPAQQPESMEQGPEQEGTLTQEPAGSSPIDQSADPAMDNTANDDAPVPQESIQSEEAARDNTVDDEPGFGEGTDPMPGDTDANDDEMTRNQ